MIAVSLTYTEVFVLVSVLVWGMAMGAGIWSWGYRTGWVSKEQAWKGPSQWRPRGRQDEDG